MQSVYFSPLGNCNYASCQLSKASHWSLHVYCPLLSALQSCFASLRKYSSYPWVPEFSALCSSLEDYASFFLPQISISYFFSVSSCPTSYPGFSLSGNNHQEGCPKTELNIFSSVKTAVGSGRVSSTPSTASNLHVWISTCLSNLFQLPPLLTSSYRLTT